MDIQKWQLKFGNENWNPKIEIEKRETIEIIFKRLKHSTLEKQKYKKIACFKKSQFLVYCLISCNAFQITKKFEKT